jgi:hypothetical protein
MRQLQRCELLYDARPFRVGPLAAKDTILFATQRNEPKRGKDRIAAHELSLRKSRKSHTQSRNSSP